MAEDGESSLDHAFAKVCDIFGFEKLNKHQEEAIQQIVEMKRDVYVNLPTGYGKSVVFQALPTVFASVDKYEKNIVIVNQSYERSSAPSIFAWSQRNIA